MIDFDFEFKNFLTRHVLFDSKSEIQKELIETVCKEKDFMVFDLYIDKNNDIKEYDINERIINILATKSNNEFEKSSYSFTSLNSIIDLFKGLPFKSFDMFKIEELKKICFVINENLLSYNEELARQLLKLSIYGIPVFIGYSNEFKKHKDSLAHSELKIVDNKVEIHTL